MPHCGVIGTFLACAIVMTAASAVRADPPGQPHVPIWSAGDQNGNSILNWDPGKDSDVAFNRSAVPLTARIEHPENVNEHARANEGGITVLTAFNLPTNNYSQGSATENTYV